jgi:hypothetical protein
MHQLSIKASQQPKSFMFLYRWFVHTLYRIYAEIHDRLTVDRDHTPIPPVPCQICGGTHTERLCPKAKEMGF